MSAADVNKVFLQAVLSRKLISDDLIRVLFKKAVEAVNAPSGLNIAYSPRHFDEAVGKVNDDLVPLNMKLDSFANQDDGQRVWCLINVKGDEIAQVATQYSAMEIQYFKLIIEQIMTAPNESFCVSSLAALRETSNVPGPGKLPKSHAEILLQSFVANNWLNRSSKGRYTLSSRALMELEPYLKSTYEDEILICSQCTGIVTKGISCYARDCPCRMHIACYQRWASSSAGRNRGDDNDTEGLTVKCKICAVPWSPSENSAKLKKVGEEAAREGDDRQRVRRHVDKEEEVDEEEGPNDDLEDEDKAPQTKKPTAKPQAARKSRAATAIKSSRGKDRAAQRDNDSEEEEGEENSMDVDEQMEGDEDVKPVRRSGRR